MIIQEYLLPECRNSDNTIIRLEYAYNVAAHKYRVHNNEDAKEKTTLVRKSKVPCWI